jgi:F0F1-type ATP synthase membrane subunit b/b'
MDILRNLFGNLAAGIIRLAVAVGVLAATYVFIVKPVLDTTENVSNSVNNSIEAAHEEFEASFGPHSEAAKAIRRANRQVQNQITRTFHKSRTTRGGDSTKLVRCIQRAAGDVDRMQRCAKRF